MSNLLINEPPLQVLPSLAKAVGLNEAIILQQMHYWLRISKNERDGHTWVYKTYEEWREEFPFWSTDTIQRTIRKLENAGLVVSTDQYNRMKIDRTKWYRIDYTALDAVTSTAICGDENRKVPSSREPQNAALLPENKNTSEKTATALSDYSDYLTGHYAKSS